MIILAAAPNAAKEKFVLYLTYLYCGVDELQSSSPA